MSTARYWIGTLYNWVPPDALPPGATYFGGQQERCPTSGRLHHQVVIALSSAVRVGGLARYGVGHWERTRSSSARAYCFKEDTRVLGSQFSLGTWPLRRNNATDWESVRQSAIAGDLPAIPADVFIRYYRSLKGLLI